MTNPSFRHFRTAGAHQTPVGQKGHRHASSFENIPLVKLEQLRRNLAATWTNLAAAPHTSKLQSCQVAPPGVAECNTGRKAEPASRAPGLAGISWIARISQECRHTPGKKVADAKESGPLCVEILRFLDSYGDRTASAQTPP